MMFFQSFSHVPGDSSPFMIKQGQHTLLAHRSLFAKHLTGPVSRELSITDRGTSIHEHMHHSLSIMMRIGKGANVSNRIQIEDHNVGSHTGNEKATIGHTKDPSWKRGHTPNCFL